MSTRLGELSLDVNRPCKDSLGERGAYIRKIATLASLLMFLIFADTVEHLKIYDSARGRRSAVDDGGESLANLF